MALACIDEIVKVIIDKVLPLKEEIVEQWEI